ncbi:hypothetical protein Dimus_035761, partial [Dionaea muscipula]
EISCGGGLRSHRREGGPRRRPPPSPSRASVTHRADPSLPSRERPASVYREHADREPPQPRAREGGGRHCATQPCKDPPPTSESHRSARRDSSLPGPPLPCRTTASRLLPALQPPISH